MAGFRFSSLWRHCVVAALCGAFAGQPLLAQDSDPVLQGAIDVHAHLDPDGFGPGHNAPEEVLLMTAEARRLGVDVLITHPLLESVGMNLEQMRRAVEMGAYLEFVSEFANEESSIEEHVRVIRAIGPEHCIVSSDRGQGRGPEGHDDVAALTPHTVGLARAAQALRAHGFTEAELDLMFKENPARLLGLPVRLGF